MTPETLRTKLESDAGRWPRRDWALLDVREQGEAHAGHIPTATFLPRRLVEARIFELLPDRSVHAVIYDSGMHPTLGKDSRAALARETLESCGYSNVTILEGGYADWLSSGAQVSKGSNVPCKAFGEAVLEEDEVPSIDPEELHESLRSGTPPAICDVRTYEEYHHHHLPGAISTPGFDLAGHLPDLQGKSPFVLINCAGRTRSIIATATARKLGCDAAWGLRNGTMGWQIAGQNVTSENCVSMTPVHNSTINARAEELADKAGVGRVSAGELAGLLDGNIPPYVFDLRTMSEFRNGHIPGSIALPGGQLIQRTDDYAAIPAHPIVLVDNGCSQAALAGYWLRRMGFPDVSRLVPDISGWMASGAAIATGRRSGAAFQIADDERVQEIAAADLDPSAIFQGYSILDIRTSREFQSAHIEGAHWAPRGWLEHAARNMQQMRKPLLVARDERQARLGAAQLIAVGIPSVAFVADGMNGWQACGHSAVQGDVTGSPYYPDLVEPPYSKGIDEMRAYIEWEVALK